MPNPMSSSNISEVMEHMDPDSANPNDSTLRALAFIFLSVALPLLAMSIVHTVFAAWFGEHMWFWPYPLDRSGQPSITDQPQGTVEVLHRAHRRD